MKLIIDISEDEVNECKMQVDMIKQEGFLIENLNTALKIYVANGTPLPKGHGRLIDADEIQFENADFDTYGDYCRAFDAIDQADTIIEADKPESKDKLDGDPIDIDKAIEHYEGTLEALKGIDWEVDDE